MPDKQSYNKKWDLFAWCLFLIFTLLISYKVLPFFGGIGHNDAGFFWNSGHGYYPYFSTWDQNELGLDISNTLFLHIPKLVLMMILSVLHIPTNFISYFFSFGIVYLCSMTYFYIFRKISNSYLYGILAGLFVILNNLSFEHIAFGGYFYFFAGLMSFAFLFNGIYQFEKEGRIAIKTSIILALTSLLIVHPFYYAIYFGVLFLYLFYFLISHKNRLKNLFLVILLVLLIIAIHSYWIGNFLYSSTYQDPMATYGQENLKNVYEGFLRVVSFTNSISFFQYFNFFSKHLHQTIFHYIFYYLLFFSVPIATVYAFYKKLKWRFLLLWLLLTQLVFFNMAMGPVSKVTGPAWTFLWENFSIFSFFRSFSRFLIILIPIYILFFSLFIQQSVSKYKKIVLSALIILLLVLNKVAFTGDLKGSILATKIPAEYKLIDEKYFKKDKQTNNILGLPNYSYETYTWGTNKNTQLITQDYYLKDALFSKQVVYERNKINFHRLSMDFEKVFNDMTDFKGLNESLVNLNIKYVLLQKDLVGFPNNNPNEYKIFERYFTADDPSHFQLLESNQYFNLYEFKGESSVIKADNAEVQFKKISPTKYRIDLKNLQDSTDLTFLQNFNPKWRLYFTEDKLKNCQVVSSSKGVTECSQGKFEIYDIKDIQYLFKKSNFLDSHDKFFSYANSWHISKDYVEKNIEKNSYTKNADGSINLSFVLYFKPEAVFTFGLAATTGIFLVIGAYLLLRKARCKEDQDD